MDVRPLTLMAVHAHPDDEVIATGGVLARYAAEGFTTIVVTCTDGRCGDGVAGAKPGEPGHDPAAVVAVRRAELEASCQTLKVTHLELLNYHDSGMMGWPANDEPGSFWRTPVAEAANRLADLIRRYQPDVVVTYDDNGTYGHPDHLQANRITMAAVELVGGDRKVYWSTIPHSWLQNLGQRLRDLGVDWNEPDPNTTETAPPMGVPDEQITTWVDTSGFGEQKYDALAAHASQSDGAFFLRLGRDRFTELTGTEAYIRVNDTTGATLPEDDLFAGLRSTPRP